MSAEILLVERSDNEARRVRELLEQSGGEFSVERVSRLHEAKQRLSVHHYDAIVVDPEESMGGSSMVAQLHESDRDAAIVVLSRDADDWLASDAINHGAQALLRQERLDREGLRDTICQAIARQQHQRVTEKAFSVASGTSDGLRSVVESLPVGIIIHDQDRLLLINAAAARIVRATGTCLWRQGLAPGGRGAGLVRVHLGESTYGLRIHDRPTHWRHRQARLMTLHLIELGGQNSAVQTDPKGSFLPGSLQSLIWRHHRLQEFWQRVAPLLEALSTTSPKVKDLVDEYEPQGLMSELDWIDASLKSLVERMCNRPSTAPT